MQRFFVTFFVAAFGIFSANGTQAQTPALFYTPESQMTAQEHPSVLAPRPIVVSQTANSPAYLPENPAVVAQAPVQNPLPQQQPQGYVISPTEQQYANFQSAAIQAQEHPLAPVIRWAKQGRSQVAAMSGYTAILRKQENINGKLYDGNIMEVKVRHQPFSVYLKFLVPKGVSGQEVIYVEGQNNGKMLAHGVGVKALAGAQSLDPLGSMAMSGNKYPITDIGILNLIDKLVEVGEQDIRFGECSVQYYENAKIGNRVCTCVEVTHPKKYNEFRFYIARIYIDNELNLPIRYESFDWPKSPDAKPELLEAYSYENLKTNVPLGNEDFDATNPSYSFY